MSLPRQVDGRLLPLWQDEALVTPAFVYDEPAVLEKLALLAEIRGDHCRLLYSIKAAACASLLRLIAEHVDGFSASSPFECRLAREILGDRGSLHLTSPGLTTGDMPQVAASCDYLSFNSLPQWERCRPYAGNLSCGLRINPQLSFIADERYDPCRPFSKLGVPLRQLAALPVRRSGLPDGLRGIHIHTNCGSENIGELERTIQRLTTTLKAIMPRLEWVNLGGGYLFTQPAQVRSLDQLMSGLAQKYGVDVFIEPGKAIVGAAGYLVATVVDMFDTGGLTIALLDTSVNHLPEVFEYQSRPVVLQEVPGGKHVFRLAGASCLSGDLFGDYAFERPLDIGSRVIFANVGAYMMVKASMFNGINLPAVYALTTDGALQLRKEYDYDHYRRTC